MLAASEERGDELKGGTAVPASTPTPVMDYEGSGYRQDFWEGQGREYEDAVERLALRRLLPRRGGRIAEIGAGFGRLADLYLGYDQIVLFDYSRTLLADAVAKWGRDRRFVFVAGNLYQPPLADATLDALVMVRVMHHLADVPAALASLRPLLHRGSAAILEFANKRNLKAVLRWLARRQSWSPFDPAPQEFVAMNFDFHPGWMAAQLQNAGLRVEERYGASHFRLGALKRSLPTHTWPGWTAACSAWAASCPSLPAFSYARLLRVPRKGSRLPRPASSRPPAARRKRMRRSSAARLAQPIPWPPWTTRSLHARRAAADTGKREVSGTSRGLCSHPSYGIRRQFSVLHFSSTPAHGGYENVAPKRASLPAPDHLQNKGDDG